MRNFTPQTETQLLLTHGTEPMIVISVDWVQDGNVVHYTDRAISGQPVEGRIISISPLDNVFTLEGNTDSKEISITLDDADGILKGIINNNNIHMRPASVYHWDASTPINDRALLFKGVINGPITWNEGDRTLSFSILNVLEDAEYGFSLDESLGIANQPLNLQDKVWPLCFGVVTNVPALRLTGLVEGILETGVGIKDFALIPKYNYIGKCAKCLTCRSGSTFNSSTGVSTAKFAPCSNCNRRVCVELRKLELKIMAQNALQFKNITITSAGRFPQGEIITLKIDGAKFTGFFDGTNDNPTSIFTINRREHSQWRVIGSANAKKVATTINNEINNLIDTNCGPATRDLVDISSICNGIPLDETGLPQEQADGVSDFWRVFNAWPEPGLQYIDAGAVVTLENGADHTYVVNLIAEDTDSEGAPTATIISSVKARKKAGSTTRLIEVPTGLYSVRTTEWGSYTTTELVFSKLLSEVDSDWSDDIFVSLKSAVGPNIVEIMEWLITTYTTFSINAASFSSVKVDLLGWGANFALLERGNILGLLKDIAFQARCALYIKDNEIFLQFLAKRPTIVDTILESDVENNSLVLGHTTTEDLVTKFVASWTFDYSQKEKVKTVLRFNVAKYGLKERDFDFFIYSDEKFVKEASLFWLIRKSQIWRRLSFKTPIHKLQLETFDSVEVNFNDFSPNNILAYIEQATYDSSDYSISFDCWTPVRSGAQEEYNFAFPEDVAIDTFFPTQEDIESGAFDTSSPGVLVLAPVSPDDPVHPLSGQTECDGPVSILRPQVIPDCWNFRYGRTDPETCDGGSLVDNEECQDAKDEEEAEDKKNKAEADEAAAAAEDHEDGESVTTFSCTTEYNDGWEQTDPATNADNDPVPAPEPEHAEPVEAVIPEEGS